MHVNATRREVITHGLIAGVIGMLAVAVVFAVANMAVGRSPFYTAALLGASFLHDVTYPAQVSVTAANVLAYTGLHLAVFLAFGVLASALAAIADRGWQLWFVALFFFIFVSFHLVAAVQVLAAPLQALMRGTAIWGAGIAASVAMAVYLVWAHPRIRAPQSW